MSRGPRRSWDERTLDLQARALEAGAARLRRQGRALVRSALEAVDDARQRRLEESALPGRARAQSAAQELVRGEALQAKGKRLQGKRIGGERP